MIWFNFLYVHKFVRPSTIHVDLLFSAAVIVGSMKPCIIIEPRCEKTGLRGFRPGRTQTGLYSDKMAGGLKFRIQIVEGLYYPCSENKGADQLRGNCVFVFAYAKSRFSHDAAQLSLTYSSSRQYE